MKTSVYFGGRRAGSGIRPGVAVAALGALLLMTAASAGAAGKPGGGSRVSHTAIQTLPIQLGTSGGWSFDLANGYCCGGTLGSLVDIDGTQYVLSNWHVLAMDTAAGGNGRIAEAGDPVIQPGLIDVGCTASGAQTVGNLAMTAPPSDPVVNVDAAIAQVVPGMVSADGAILEIGVPSNQTAAAFVGQAVKKSGRTTGLSRSAVSGLYATVNVSYENECAGQTAFRKTYANQILIKNRGSKFLNSGDSGSLMVEDVATNPRAVGLLFAGSSTIAVANPIDEVLATLGGATMVGASAAAGAVTASPTTLQIAVERAHAIQQRHAAALAAVPDGIGHAVGLNARGRVVIKVLLATDSPRARAAAPRSLEGVPVILEVVGKVVAF